MTTHGRKPPLNFSWVLPDRLAGMARPGFFQDLDSDLTWLAAAGVRLVITLTESPLPAEELARHGIAVRHLPVVDFTAPSRAQLAEVVRCMREEGPVAVHCFAGQGRTGTALAACLVAEGMGADEAIARVRALRHPSIETEEQEEAVREFARLR
ncbi:MAG: protein-tyrosine phosphatase family protein [Pseudomonadota bacterium]